MVKAGFLVSSAPSELITYKFGEWELMHILCAYSPGCGSTTLDPDQC